MQGDFEIGDPVCVRPPGGKLHDAVRPEMPPLRRACHVWTYMDSARLQSILASYGSRSQLLTTRLPYAA